jgi:GT2 family glycosyltransferase
MLVSIIIPVFNQVSFTQKCIKDLLQLKVENEIIVIDNNSTDGTDSFFSSLSSKNLKYLKLNSNVGFGAANNIGVENSSGKNLLFLNNDVCVLKDKDSWIDPLLNLCQDRLLSSQSGLLDFNFNFVKEVSDPHVLKNSFEYLSGWSLLGSRELFNQISQEEGVIWSKKYFAYFEDAHLSWKARDLKIPMEVVKTPLHHFGRITSSKMGLSKMYQDSYKIFSNYWKSKK